MHWVVKRAIQVKIDSIIVKILGDQTATPEITSDHEGGMVDKLHTVRLECETANAKIYYTLDGTAPELHKLHPKVCTDYIIMRFYHAYITIKFLFCLF